MRNGGEKRERERNVKINNSNGKSVCVGLGFGGSRASSARGLTVERCCGGVTAADAGAGLGAGALVSVAGCAGCGASVISVCVAFVLSIMCREKRDEREKDEQEDEGGRGCSQRLIHWKWGDRWVQAWLRAWSRSRPCGVAHPPTAHGSQVGGRRGTVVSWSGSDSDRSAAHTLFTYQKSVEHAELLLFCGCCKPVQIGWSQQHVLLMLV